MNLSEQKTYRIGIDVGTASVAAVAIALDDLYDQPYTDAELPPPELYESEDAPSYGDYSYLAHRLRLFDEPVDNNKGTYVSKNSARRTARLARRQISRRSARLRGLRDLGLQHRLIVPGDGFDRPAATPLPQLRAEAAHQRVELCDLLRIILRLSKRRGYKGDFRPRPSDKGAEDQGAEDKMKEVELGRQCAAQGNGFEYSGGISLQPTIFARQVNQAKTGRRYRRQIQIQIQVKIQGRNPRPKSQTRTAISSATSMPCARWSWRSSSRFGTLRRGFMLNFRAKPDS